MYSLLLGRRLCISAPERDRGSRRGRSCRTGVRFHCWVIDGVFATGEDGRVHFAEARALTPEDLAAVQQQGRAHVLRWFARAGHLDPADARDMAGWMPRCA